MSYKVPDYSSSPPSTPDRRSNNGTSNAFSFGGPSTTPAGPPPSSSGSFTPAGPPPSSYFGSSMMETASPLKPLSFSQQSSFGKYSASGNYMRLSFAPQRSGLSNMSQPSPQRSFGASANDLPQEEESEYMDEDEQEDSRYDNDQSYANEDSDAMTDDGPSYQYQDAKMDDIHSTNPGSRPSVHRYTDPDLLHSTPELNRQSRERSNQGHGNSVSQSLSKSPPLSLGKIAKDMYTHMASPSITERDDLILATEALVERLYDEGIDDESLQEALQIIPGELVALWERHYQSTIRYSQEVRPVKNIGPATDSSDFAKANFLAGLALQIHQPPGQTTMFGQRTKPLPQILLEWMDDHHNLSKILLEQVQASKPSPAASPQFWNCIFNTLLRGQVLTVVKILKNAGWRYARTESEDLLNRSEQDGFTGVALENVNKVISAAARVLSECPAKDNDWHIRDDRWKMFRLQVSKALEDLRTFAEGRNRESAESLFGPGIASKSKAPGKKTTDFTYSQTAKKAESKVPWHIYQNLITLYNLVLGDVDVIIGNAQDWCEATIGLLVWWDESKDDRRLALGRSRGGFRGMSMETDSQAYKRKLRESFRTAIRELTINTADEVEVGLALLFEGDNEAVVGFLRGWSGPLSSAVAEIATLGAWLPKPEEKSLITMGSLDQEDLDLLGITSSSRADGAKDQTLIAYARLLARKGQLKCPGKHDQQQVGKDGWELAIVVLGRLDSAPRSEEVIGQFLHDLSLDSSSKVDRLWKLLNDLSLDRLAENTAESYANILAEDSRKYGEALWYYALAHRNEKVKDVLDLLISFSLIHSTAYPPEPELDDHLRHLIKSPKNSLTEISKMDLEAAELLQKMLSGYATLRRFYDLRDEEVLLVKGSKNKKGAISRRAEAAAALMTVITSSDDNIRGGLYDEGRGAVVNVDFLLVLLGEAMVFVDQPNYTMPVWQIEVLLKAIEDLDEVSSRVRSSCTEFLQAAIQSCPNLKDSSPTDVLRQSTSNVSGTSSFSMVGSSMLASQMKQSMSSSGVLVKGNIKRGWDWREGVTSKTTDVDVLRILRLGLAKSLAKAWLLEADNIM